MKNLLTTAALITLLLPLAACNQTSRTRTDANLIAARSDETLAPLPDTNENTPDLERAALNRLLGNWDLAGWAQPDPDQPRTAPRGIAIASTDHQNFLRIDVTASAPTPDRPNHPTRYAGTMLFAAGPDHPLTMSAWFDFSHRLANFTGATDIHARVIVLDETNPPDNAPSLRIVIRFLSDNHWTAEILDRTKASSPTIAKFNLHRAG